VKKYDINMTRIGIFVCLVSILSTAEAFSPSTTATTAATATATTSRPSTRLFMNKKKKTPVKAKTQGFAGALKSLQTKGFPYAGGIRPGKQSPQRIVLDEKSVIVYPDYANDGRPKKGSNSPLLPWVIEVKTSEEIEKMRVAGKLAREILDMGGRAVAAGVTTDEIDTLVHEAIVEVSPTTWNGISRAKYCTIQSNQSLEYSISIFRLVHILLH
jgi:methionyl aminopeptidase